MLTAIEGAGIHSRDAAAGARFRVVIAQLLGDFPSVRLS